MTDGEKAQEQSLPAEPHSRGDLFHAKITRCFEYDERDEKDDQCDIELVTGKVEIFLQPLDTGIPDVDAVDKWKEPNQEERGQEVKITFTRQFADSFVIREGSRLLDSGSWKFPLLQGRELTHIEDETQTFCLEDYVSKSQVVDSRLGIRSNNDMAFEGCTLDAEGCIMTYVCGKDSSYKTHHWNG